MKRFAAILALPIELVAWSPASATTWHIPTDAPTIQAGIDSASAGDTVLVVCGTYYERWIQMKSGVCLRSATGLPGCVTLNGEGIGEIINCYEVDDKASIEGFTLTNGVADYGGGMLCWDSSPAISNCVFSGHLAEAGAGLYCNSSSPTLSKCTFSENEVVEGGGGGMACVANSSPTLIRCTFENNAAYYFSGGGGLYAWDQSSPTLDHCVFYNNSAEYVGGALMCDVTASATLANCTLCSNSASGGAVFCANGSSATLENCLIAFGTAGGAVRCDGSGNATLTCCDVYGNVGGDWAGCIAGQGGINGNISLDPLLCSPVVGDFHLEEGSPCAPFSAPNPECSLIGAYGVGCAFEPRIWRVPGHAPTIRAGIDSASAGDTVVVACGTYYEHYIVMKPSIGLRSESGEPECVIIDAEHVNRAFICYEVDSTAVIRGFTIIHGYSPGSVWPLNSGGGVYCESSSLRITDCRFVNNSANSGGAGIACAYSSPILTGCEFTDNSATRGTGVYCRLSSHPRMSDCSFSANTAGYAGGGMSCDGGSSPVLTGCAFLNNSASEGGGVYCEDNSSVTLSGCTFSGNTAVVGGGMNITSSSASLTGCTFHGNGGSLEASGIFCQSSTLAIENTILAFGSPGMAIYCNATPPPVCSPTLVCCDLYGNAGGDWVGCIAGQDSISGNFSADPMFCEPDSGDFQIQSDSPCAPDNSPPGCELIGALPVGCAATSVAASEIHVPVKLSLASAVPNPFNAVTAISYDIPASDEPSRVTVHIYNALGRKITTLVDADQGPGTYHVTWDGRDHRGVDVASGVYFCGIGWNGKSRTKRMVLLK